MEKTPKTFNARFEKEVFWAIADLVAAKYGRDKTEAVGRAILEAKARVDGYGGGMADVVPVQRQANELTEALMVHQEASIPERDRGFPIQCRHCRSRERGATKFATVCFGCKGGGHSNDPAECPVCTMMGTGAL